MSTQSTPAAPDQPILMEGPTLPGALSSQEHEPSPALDPLSASPRPRIPVSERKLAANRANAQKSTGPKTPEGKERVAQNGLTHGLLASSLKRLLTAATPEERESYVPLVEQLYRELDPCGVREHLLVERLAVNYLRQLRVHRVENNAMLQRLARESSWEKYGPDDLPDDIALVLRYDAQAERSISRALRDLRRLQRERRQAESALERQARRLLAQP